MLIQSLKSDQTAAMKEEKMHDCIHLSVQKTRDEESSMISSVDGCKWRLQYIEKECIPNSIQCAIFFLQYPIVAPTFSSHA